MPTDLKKTVFNDVGMRTAVLARATKNNDLATTDDDEAGILSTFFDNACFRIATLAGLVSANGAFSLPAGNSQRLTLAADTWTAVSFPTPNPNYIITCRTDANTVIMDYEIQNMTESGFEIKSPEACTMQLDTFPVASDTYDTSVTLDGEMPRRFLTALSYFVMAEWFRANGSPLVAEYEALFDREAKTYRFAPDVSPYATRTPRYL